MALIKCHECGNEVSTEATGCQKCGAKPRKKSNLTATIAGVFLAVVVVIWVTGMVNHKNPDIPYAKTESTHPAAPVSAPASTNTATEVVSEDVLSVRTSRVATTAEGKCVLLGAFAENAANLRDAKKSIYLAMSNETPWNEIDLNSKKAIVVMVSNVGDLMYSPPRIVAEKIFAQCTRDPEFLQPLISTFPPSE